MERRVYHDHLHLHALETRLKIKPPNVMQSTGAEHMLKDNEINVYFNWRYNSEYRSLESMVGLTGNFVRKRTLMKKNIS